MKHHFHVSFSDYSFPNAFKLNVHPHVLLSHFRMNELKEGHEFDIKNFVSVSSVCVCV